MKTYHIGCMVRHSGKHLETEVAAYSLNEAIWIFNRQLLGQDLSMEALSELDVSEVVQ